MLGAGTIPAIAPPSLRCIYSLYRRARASQNAIFSQILNRLGSILVNELLTPVIFSARIRNPLSRLNRGGHNPKQ